MKAEILGFKSPQKECTDKKCPFHGEMNVKKEVLKGVVVRKDLNNSATISWLKSRYVPKYERFEVRRSRLRVHNPECIEAQVGDNVVVARCRPLSKTKNHIVIGKVEGKSKKELMAEELAHEKKSKNSKEVTEKNKTQDQENIENESN